MSLLPQGRGRQAALSFVVFLANYLADRGTKVLAKSFLIGKKPISMLGGSVVLRYTENTGAFLGMGANWPTVIKYSFLLVVPIVLCIYGLYYCAIYEKDRTRLILLACIIGGGLGNLGDRLFNGFAVTDFLNFGIGKLRTGVLNVADLSVTFGALALIAYEFKVSKKPKQEP